MARHHPRRGVLPRSTSKESHVGQDNSAARVGGVPRGPRRPHHDGGTTGIGRSHGGARRSGSIPEFCAEIEGRIRAERYYLSPCEQNGQMNLLPTLRLLGELNERPGKPHWQLSIQTHKLAGIE